MVGLTVRRQRAGMSKVRLVVTAVVVEKRSQDGVARAYGFSEGRVSKLMDRHRAEGEKASEPRSRRPRTSPEESNPQMVAAVVSSPDVHVVLVALMEILSMKRPEAFTGPLRRYAHNASLQRGFVQCSFESKRTGSAQCRECPCVRSIVLASPPRTHDSADRCWQVGPGHIGFCDGRINGEPREEDGGFRKLNGSLLMAFETLRCLLVNGEGEQR